MEHKWGRDVFKLGLIDTGATLASRLRRSPREVVTNALDFQAGVVEVWRLPADPQEEYFRFFFERPANHPTFPYGYDVQPDEPL